MLRAHYSHMLLEHNHYHIVKSEIKMQNNFHTMLNRTYMELDPLRPVKNGCNGFHIVKSVPLPCDYNVLTLLSFYDAVENTSLDRCTAADSIFYCITQNLYCTCFETISGFLYHAENPYIYR